MPAEISVNEWRSRLNAGIDQAVAYAQKAWNDKRSGQNDLFGVAQGTEISDSFQLPEKAPWSQSEVSRNEKASLGFYLSSHPLDEYSGIRTG